MYFFVGLGNPGIQYENTRHNVGWLFLDFWQKQHNFPSFNHQSKFKAEISKLDDNFLVKPQTFMNNSGEAVRSVLQFYHKESLNNQQPAPNAIPMSFGIAGGSIMNSLFVVHDDLDIPFGSFKIQFGTGPKVHNGVNSIRQHLKTDQFWYIRIGVDGRNGQRTMPGHAYVLQAFSTDEKNTNQQVFQDIQTRLQLEQKIV